MLDNVNWGQLYGMLVPDSQSGKISKEMIPHIAKFLENEICGNGQYPTTNGLSLMILTNQNPSVAYLVNTAIYRERGQDPDPKQTYKHLANLAKLGVGNAGYLAGKMRFEGRGTDVDHVIAAEYFIEVIENTSQPIRGLAFEALSRLISESRRLSPRAAEKIEECYTKHGCFNSFVKYQLSVATYYSQEYKELFHDHNHKKDLATTLIDAVNQDIPGALKEFASILFDHKHELYGTVAYGTFPNLNRTNCYKRAANELNIAEAQYQYAKRCEAGEYSFLSEFVIFPEREATKYYEIAAKQGHIRACQAMVDKGKDLSYAYYVGMSYLKGENGVNKSNATAWKYLSIAFQQSSSTGLIQSETPEVVYQIAHLFGEFDGYEDFNIIYPKMLHIAANKGYKPALVEQQACNGDNDAALELHQLLSTGQTSLGQLSSNKIPLARLIQAAINGSTEAFNILIKLRCDPEVLKEWGNEKIELLDIGIKKALKNKDPEEAYQLARNYLLGNSELGIPANLKIGLARNYFMFAIQQGFSFIDKVKQEPLAVIWEISHVNLELQKNNNNSMNNTKSVKAPIVLLDFLVKNNYRPAMLREQTLQGDTSAAFDMYQMLTNGDEQTQLRAKPERAISYLIRAVRGGHARAIREATRLVNSKSLSDDDTETLRNLIIKINENKIKKEQLIEKSKQSELTNEEEQKLHNDFKNLAFAATNSTKNSYSNSERKTEIKSEIKTIEKAFNPNFMTPSIIRDPREDEL
jgi:TPR repeat protein